MPRVLNHTRQSGEEHSCKHFAFVEFKAGANSEEPSDEIAASNIAAHVLQVDD